MRGHMDRVQEKRSRAVRRFLWMAGILLSLLLFDMHVYAAGGRLSIATDTNVPVGSEVTVVLSATASGGERASANMEFTYSSSIFSFVSCNAENYSGGPGGSVSFYGSSVTVKLRAESAGSGSFKLTGSNGMVSGSGAALDQMEAAGVTVEVAGEGGSSGSADNSLASLSLSQGELSPAFSSADTIYTASVPYETESLEVNAEVSHPKAKITSIEGNSELKVGENTIQITVEAENGEVAVYTITVTRAEAPKAPPEEGNGEEPPQGGDGQTPPEGDPAQTAPQEPEDNAAIEEYEEQLMDMKDQYQKLLEKYRKEKSDHRKVMAILIFLLVILVIVCVNIIIFRRGRGDQEDEDPVSDRLLRAQERKQAREEAKREKQAAKAEKEEKKEKQAAKAEKEEKKEKQAAKAEKEEKKEKQAAKAEKEEGKAAEEKKTAKEEKRGLQGIGKEEKPTRRKMFGRKAKEEWLDEEDVDMESAIFSTTIIPAPRREDGASDETVDFIDLDKL